MIGDVSWPTPGRSSADSLPLGNGDIAGNVWVEADGTIGCYLAKNDAWDALGRLIKVGRLRFRLDPPLLAEPGTFSQQLLLGDGAVVVTQGALTVKFWIDAHWPRLVVEVNSPTPRRLEVAIDRWREHPRTLDAKAPHAALGFDGGPIPLVAAPDHVLDEPGALIWYQRNESSVWGFTLEQQGLASLRSSQADPLLHRTFGGRIAGLGMTPADAWTLRSEEPGAVHVVTTTLHLAQTATVAEWAGQLRRQAGDNVPAPASAWPDHTAWWKEFWGRSYLRLEALGPDWGGAAAISELAAWQRYLVACCSRGLFPVKFNGALFTADWEFPDEAYDADYRRWGGGYWWQNTRLPYWAALAAGDFEFLRPLFRMYRDMLPLAAERTRRWFGHGGVFFPETALFWGAFLPSNYGWNRADRKPGDVENRYVGRLYVCGLEILALMLETHHHTGDRAMVEQELLPIARGVLAFYGEHYPNDPDGRLRLAPAQALETWWETENPLPDVAGLHAVLARLRGLPAGLVPADDRARWRELEAKLPPLPQGTHDGQPLLRPAAKHEPVPRNSENAELYSIFPFRLHGVGLPDLDLARWTFANRHFPDTGGWRQDAVQAALLGLTEPAAYYVTKNATQGRTSRARFAGFWGPNYDWIPDLDHGSVTHLALQAMLLQCVGDKLYLFPAWPVDRWNVSFRLHAPGHTVIEGELRGGKLERLVVTPPERARDVVVGKSVGV